MIGVYAPMISEKPSRDTPAYKADKNAFACITGMGEDQFFEEVIAALKSVGK